MKQTFDEILQLQKAGHLQAAKSAYLDLLAEFPAHSEAWHMLGIVYAEEGLYAEAINALQQALKIDENSSSIPLHLANIYKANGEIALAQQTLEQLIAKHPTFAAAYNNLGIIYFTLRNWPAAIDAYQTAIDLQPDFVDAYYNLGLTYSKQAQIDRAMPVYQAILELAPEHPGAKFQLAMLYMQQENFQRAYIYLNEMAAAFPYHFETQSNLATCYLRLGKLDSAKAHYLLAHQINANDLQILFNLGVIAMQQANMQLARDYYHKALALNPDFVEAHNNIAIVYLALKDVAEARKHFCEVLRLQSDNPSVQHTINILNQTANIDHSPPEYIQALFDSYADHYDVHLTQSLDYQVPQLLYDRLAPYLSSHKLDVIDLGAGTGLSGELFKRYAKRLVGVDLSKKMLALAAQKNIYDALHCQDIVTYLQATKERFDLVIAADVLVYFGDLMALFKAVADVLNNNGWFIFNTEISSNKAYALTTTGRFIHHKSYVEQLAADNGFKIVTCDIAPIRKHEAKEVMGQLWVLEKQM